MVTDSTWEEEWQGPESGQFLFLAEFTWDGMQDEAAEGRFKFWRNGLFPVPDSSITEKQCKGYYLTGKRTFWIIFSAKDHDEANAFCKRVTGEREAFPSPVKFDCYECVYPLIKK